MRALILVDIQNDFCPGGALAVPDGDAVVPIANKLIDQFELVVATQDWHPANHKSFASQNEGISIGDCFDLNGIDQVAWPDHCISGSQGAEFHSDLNTQKIEKVFLKGQDATVDSYSGFFDNDHRTATGLGDYLKSKNVEQVFVLGLATDYCVKFTAIDAVKLGFQTHLVVNGCRGVDLNSGDVEKALEAMQDAGVTNVSSEQVQ